MKIVQMFSRPSLADWTAEFEAGCERVGLGRGPDVVAEARRVFEYYTKADWRDRSKQSIKFWPRIVDLAVTQYQEKHKPGYVAKKKDLHIPDCCFRPQAECDCARLVYRAGRGYVFPRDLMKATMESDEGEAAAACLLTSRRKNIAVPVSVASDDDFLRTTATDIGRGVLAVAESRDEYFGRMGWWMEFVAGIEEGWCPLGPEMMALYCGWTREHGGLVRQGEEDVWGMCGRVRGN